MLGSNTPKNRLGRRRVWAFLTWLLTGAYLVLSIRNGLRLSRSSVNSSARWFFGSALLCTGVLFASQVVVTVTLRSRGKRSNRGVLLAALFGIFVCLVFFGL